MTNTQFTFAARATFAKLLRSKRFFTLAALLAFCFGAHATEAAAAPKALTTCKTITLPGSYILTKNLTAVGNCLVVEADNVTIDLDGYTITGDGAGVIGYGIYDGNVAREKVTVRNGVVTNFLFGVSLDESSHVTVEHVRAIKNSYGITTGNGAIIRDNVASGNVITGIVSGEGNLVTGNVASGNGSYGIAVYCASNVVGNTATSNGVGNINFLGAGCRSSLNVPNVAAP